MGIHALSDMPMDPLYEKGVRKFLCNIAIHNRHNNQLKNTPAKLDVTLSP
jgi:hypothetical protein